jgi:hypothetical protein
LHTVWSQAITSLVPRGEMRRPYKEFDPVAVISTG